MAFTEITPEEININPFTSWSRYVLVTAGNIEKCNTLLVTWGGFGVMWRKKTATIYIRQSRFTKTILDSQDYFTLSFLPEKHKPQMSYMGSHSGREAPDSTLLLSETRQASKKRISSSYAKRYIPPK